ncbi:hypothetical protein ES703_47160 [subsurface metagenome]
MAVTLVEKYNPEWPKWFEEIKAFLGEKVTQTCIRIEHVGSTSVRKMTANPTEDAGKYPQSSLWGGLPGTNP